MPTIVLVGKAFGPLSSNDVIQLRYPGSKRVLFLGVGGPACVLPVLHQQEQHFFKRLSD